MEGPTANQLAVHAAVQLMMSQQRWRAHLEVDVAVGPSTSAQMETGGVEGPVIW